MDRCYRTMDRTHGTFGMDRTSRFNCKHWTYWTVGSNGCDWMDGSYRTDRSNRVYWIHWTDWKYGSHWIHRSYWIHWVDGSWNHRYNR